MFAAKKRHCNDAHSTACLSPRTCATLIVKMKLLFSVQPPVQTFQVQEDILAQDLILLRESLNQFFNSNPSFVVVDLSQASLQVSDDELQSTLIQIKTLAQSKEISLVIAQSDIESRLAHQQVLEAALLKRARILESKLELREKMKSDALRLKEENEKLREQLPKDDSIPNPLMEKLWSDRT